VAQAAAVTAEAAQLTRPLAQQTQVVAVVVQKDLAQQ
jgi:hypothetical protein